MPSSPALLAEVTRSGLVESRHFGHLAVCDGQGGVVFALGDPEHGAYLRSSAKPLQAHTVVRLGTAQRFGWSDEELAVVCASHSAEPVHVERVGRILERAGLTPEALQCGPHPPVDADSAAALVRSGRNPERIHNNCSGKHAGMLAACVHRGWPTETYLEPAHPLQQENLRTVACFGSLEAAGIPVGVDGCGVPTFYVPLRGVATAFAQLAACVETEGGPSAARRPLPAEWVSAGARVLRAMAAHPRLVAGTGRLDARLMTTLAARVVSKGGAEGMLCMALPRERLGIAIKIADGSPRALPAIALRVLEGLWGELPGEAKESSEINPPLVNTRDQVIGEIRAAFDPAVAKPADERYTISDQR